MIIRNATIQDSFSIAKVHVRTWQYAYAGIISDAYLQNLSIEKRAAEWNNILSVSTVGIVVVEVESEIVGWVSFGKSRDDENLAAVSGEIYSIYVHPDHWSNGYGKQLIEQAETKLWCNRFKIVYLWVLELNNQSREFYSKVGYSFDGSEKQLSIGGQMLWELRYVKKRWRHTRS